MAIGDIHADIVHTLYVCMVHVQVSKLKQQASAAVRLISRWLEQQHPRVLGQTPAEVIIHYQPVICVHLVSQHTPVHHCLTLELSQRCLNVCKRTPPTHSLSLSLSLSLSRHFNSHSYSCTWVNQQQMV